MERVRKHRAWHRGSKEMLYGKSSDIFRWLEQENQPIDIMDYSGLKDKNGKEIYEGDIIDNDAAKWEVVFNRGCFAARCIGRDYDSGTHIALRGIQGPVIIGNIHENPELINQ